MGLLQLRKQYQAGDDEVGISFEANLKEPLHKGHDSIKIGVLLERYQKQVKEQFQEGAAAEFRFVEKVI